LISGNFLFGQSSRKNDPIYSHKQTGKAREKGEVTTGEIRTAEIREEKNESQECKSNEAKEEPEIYSNQKSSHAR
jgi:hypothetical protein